MSPRARLRALAVSGMTASGLVALAIPAAASAKPGGDALGGLGGLLQLLSLLSDRRVKRDVTPVVWTR